MIDGWAGNATSSNAFKKPKIESENFKNLHFENYWEEFGEF